MISANVDVFGSDEFSGSGLTEEDLSSQINGVTQTFVTGFAFDTTSIVVYWNGVRQRTGIEITVVDSRTFQTQFTAPVGSVLVVTYKLL